MHKSNYYGPREEHVKRVEQIFRILDRKDELNNQDKDDQTKRSNSIDCKGEIKMTIPTIGKQSHTWEQGHTKIIMVRYTDG